MLKHFLFKNKKFLKHLSSTFGVFFINVLVMLWQTPFMLHHLGKELYGCWILAGTVLSYMGLFSFGYMNTFVAEYVKSEQKDYKFLTSNSFFSITIMLVVSIPFYILLYIFSDHIFIISEAANHKFKIALLINILSNISGFYFGYYIAILYWVKNKIQLKNSIELFVIVFNNLGYYIILGKLNGDFEHLILLNAITSIIALAFLKIFLGEAAKVDVKQFRLSYFTSKMKQSFHFLLLNLSNVLIFMGDNLMVSILMGVKSLPAYSLSFRISDYSIKILKKITEVKAPEMAHLIRDKKIQPFISLYWKIISIASILSLIACASIIAFGEKILLLWLGNKMQFDNHILTVFAFYIFFAVTLHVNWVVLTILAKHKNLSYIVLIESGLNIVLSIILYKNAGVIGFAYATLFATVVCSWWYSFYKVKKEIDKFKLIVSQ